LEIEIVEIFLFLKNQEKKVKMAEINGPKIMITNIKLIVDQSGSRKMAGFLKN